MTFKISMSLGDSAKLNSFSHLAIPFLNQITCKKCKTSTDLFPTQPWLF